MSADAHLFLAVLRHDVVLGSLAFVALLAWTYLLLGAGVGMEMMDMGGGQMMVMPPEWTGWLRPRYLRHVGGDDGGGRRQPGRQDLTPSMTANGATGNGRQSTQLAAHLSSSLDLMELLSYSQPSRSRCTARFIICGGCAFGWY